MDPVSFAASLIAIIGLTAEAAKVLGMLCDLRHAPREILELSNEVCDLQALLSLTQQAVNATDCSLLSPDQESTIQTLITGVQEPTVQLNKLVSQISPPNVVGDPRSKRQPWNSWYIAFLGSRRAIERLRKRLQRAQRNLNTALNIIDKLQGQANHELMVQIHNIVINHSDCNAPIRDGTANLTIARDTVASGGSTKCEQDLEKHAGWSPNLPAALTEEYDVDAEKRTDWLHERAVSVGAVMTKGTCSWHCQCQCHPRHVSASPRWLGLVLGSLYYSNTGTSSFQIRPCTEPGCTRRMVASCQVTYYFPRWLACRAFTFSTSYNNFSGLAMTWSIGFPRSISVSHDAWQCIELGDADRLAQLIRFRKVEVNDMADDDGTSLLLYALKCRRDGIVTLLLEFGADPHMVDPRGVSSCAYAQFRILVERMSVKPYWLSKMDDSVAESSITDDLCLSNLHKRVVGVDTTPFHQVPLEENHYVNVPDALGMTPLHWAVIMGDVHVVKALLHRGASPWAQDKEGQMPLHVVFQAPSASQTDIVDLLLRFGAPVDGLDSWGRTPLRIAVGFDNTGIELVENLLQSGAKVDLTDRYGQSPLLKSIRGNLATTHALLEAGANPEIHDIYGNTALLDAIYRGKPGHVQVLLDHGAQTCGVFNLQPGRRAREGSIHLAHFVAWYGDAATMHVLGSHIPPVYSVPNALAEFDQCQAFRGTNGLTSESSDREAFIRMLRPLQAPETNPSVKDVAISEVCDHPRTNEDDVTEVFVDAIAYHDVGMPLV